MQFKLLKEKTAGKVTAVTIVVLLLVVVGAFVIMIRYSDALVEKTSLVLGEQYAQEINSHMTANVNSTLQSFKDTAEVIHGALKQIDGLNEEKLTAFFAEMQEVSGEYLGIVGTDGALYDARGKSMATTSISFLGELMNQDSYISDNESLWGESYVMYGSRFDTPIRTENGEFWALIIGLANEDLSSQVVLTSDYSDSYTSIIQGDGYFIVKNEKEAEDGRNEFSILQKSGDLTEEEIDGLRSRIADGQSCLMRPRGSHQAYFLYFAPMESTGWVLVNHIPVEFIQSSLSTVKTGLSRVAYMTIFIIGIVAAAMLLVLFNYTRLLASTGKRLEEALGAAREANRAKTVFLNNMSHDIRTPMNAIMGLLTIAHRQNKDAAVDETLDKIGSSSSYLLSLINDVLDISRIESGKTTLRLEPAVLENIAGGALAIIQNTLSEREINFVVDRPENSEIYVMADKLRIQEVLVNIMSNAVKFTNDGGQIVFLEAHEMVQGGKEISVIYTVSDTGVGMSPEFLKNLFGEFQQEANDARTKYKGSGLGMAITKRLIDMMGGQIHVESEKGRGTTFVVELRLAVTEEVPEEIREKEVHTISTEGLNVLLAEDNDLNAEIAEFMLEDNKMSSVRAVDGQDALEKFRDNPPGTFDVILMDVMMPRMNGYEATRAIRSLDREDAKTIPILAMTANAFAEDEQKALESGMNAHLTKPINVEAVVKTISKFAKR